MGMDVYGLKPKKNTNQPNVLKVPEGKDWWDSFQKMSKKEKDAYYIAKDKYYEDNPGVYFRNNVWYWRPLWDYVASKCSHILDRDDYESGHSNSGHKINEEKAMGIAAVLYALLEDGSVKTAEEMHMEGEINSDKDGPSYPFSEENVREFAIFCEESGGFEIC